MTQPQRDPQDVSAALARLAADVAAVRRELAALDRLLVSLIEAQAEKVALALASADKAVLKAETATEKRFEGVNEFRQQLADQARNFMTRVEALAVLERHSERIQEVTDRLNRAEGQGQGRDKGRAGLYAAIGAVGVLITIFVWLANVLTR